MIDPPKGIEAIACIMIYPRSAGRLPGGNYHKDKPHKSIHVCINATNKDLVYYEETLLGSPENYTVVYEIQNYNDSAAIVWSETDKD